MMNRSSSSSNNQREKFSQSQPPPPPKKPERNLKRERIPRNPLKDISSRDCDGGGNGSSSRSSFGKAENGRLRFFLSYSSSSSSSLEASMRGGPVKSVSRTPKSAPVATKTLLKTKTKPRFIQEKTLKSSVSEKPASRKPQKCKRNTALTNLVQSRKKLSCKNTLKSNKNLVLGTVKKKLSRTRTRMEDNDTHWTPVSMLGKGLALDCSSRGKFMDDCGSNDNRSSDGTTPPLQPSVSPEIQCGSSKVSSTTIETPVYYAAEYPISSVIDKRKRRPIGTLTVVENWSDFGKPKTLNNFEDSDEGDTVVRDAGASMMPLPANASMHWLSSPCDEVKDAGKEISDDDSYQLQRLVRCEGSETPSPLSDRSFSSDVCNISSGRSISAEKNAEMRRRSISSLSPSELSQYTGCMHHLFSDDLASAFDINPKCGVDPSEHLKEERKLGEKKSPLSIDTSGSENVIQTPRSISSSDNCYGLPWLQAEGIKKHNVCSDFESLTMSLQSASLSPKSQAFLWDPSSLSYHFQSLATSSNSTDLSQFQSNLGDRRSCVSNMTADSMSEMHMRISWRDELPNIDEFDCCKCVSDEEENTNGSNKDQLIKSPQSPNADFDVRDDKRGATRSSEFVGMETASVGKDRESLHPIFPCSAAESISTDGGGLIRSEDSDWMACYKNHFVGVRRGSLHGYYGSYLPSFTRRMSGSAETTTLPPPQVYRRSEGTDEDHAVFEPRHRENAGKIILRVVASLAILLLILLMVRPFLIHKPPNASSTSVAIRSLRFNNSSSSPYLYGDQL